VTKSIIYQILPGVTYPHSPERRIAHRDIKPRNILPDILGVAVLIGFGVAYSPTASPRNVWPEPEGKMYFEMGSGYVSCFPTSNVRIYGCSCLYWALSRSSQRAAPTAVDLLQRLLVYPPDSRFKTADALMHPWLLSDAPLILPRATVMGDNLPAYTAELRGDSAAGEWLKLFLAPSLL
jgi:serine/threonine protein kinase